MHDKRPLLLFQSNREQNAECSDIVYTPLQKYKIAEEDIPETCKITANP